MNVSSFFLITNHILVFPLTTLVLGQFHYYDNLYVWKFTLLHFLVLP